MRLLVVDDDVAVRMQLSMALEDVEVVEGFRAADVLGASAGGFDAVIVDRRLPDGDGLRAVRALRTDAATAEVPVVVITADDHPSQRKAAFAAGADEHLAKPLDPAHLLAVVEGLCATLAEERKVRRTLHRARLHVGRDDGGVVDLPRREPEPEPVPQKRRFWRARSA